MNAIRILFTACALLAIPSTAMAAPVTWCEPGLAPVCWAEDPSWGAPAQAITWDWIEAMEDGGILEPSESIGGRTRCWAATFADFHFCFAYASGALLWGQPVAELEPGPSCGFWAGPWTATFALDGHCYGVYMGVAVALDL